jgi:hypothetical protein
MLKRCAFAFFMLFTFCVQSQIEEKDKDSTTVAQDSIRKKTFWHNIGNGYFPTKYFNIDLRYLIKFNQYEGFRTGLGGITNDNFSEYFRLDNYVVYGFKDDKFKYSIGGGFRVSKNTNTWINLSYTDDLQETGSSKFLTDKRFFSFFEPRLLNISLFHRHLTKAISLEHKVNNNLLTETELAVSKIEPTYNYQYVLNGVSYSKYNLSIAKISFQWSPFSNYEFINDKIVETKEGYPKFTLQVSKNFKNVLDSEFNFAKIDFRIVHKIDHNSSSSTNFILSGNYAHGDTPLTHLYHAYPNNINKETILQRFSVASINGFETMFFDEFFSDRLATFQVKHFVKPFEISHWFKPQLVLITRFALGDMDNIERHQGITFNTLDKLYTESGFEINKILFGFGLSFAYRYGAYYLPLFEDNIAFKFTFNVTL